VLGYKAIASALRKSKNASRMNDIENVLIGEATVVVEARGFMSQVRWLPITALVCLSIVASLAEAGVSQGTVQRTHLKYATRASLAQPALRSSAALVFDTTHSAVLYSRHSDVAMPIASITKLMTALVVMDAGQPLGEVLVVSDEDTSLVKTSVSRLAPGTRLSRGDFMHLALMSSENRAAHVLGRSYPGGLAACVAAMNAKARELGMTNARFVEPTGLSDENVASPEDLSKLVMAAAKVPQIREYSTDNDYEVSVGARTLRFRNTDSLVSKPDWNIVVQKTGYISEAGRCLVMQTLIEDRSVVIVLLNSFGKRTRVADASRVRKWVESTLFAHGTRVAAST
jgi:D-alanyl-D-alanine endopeptidase (penicillin-binding protein 7)